MANNVQCKNCFHLGYDDWCAVVRDSPDSERLRNCEHYYDGMPDELTDYAKELIQKCPQLINLFAEKINRMINNFEPSDPDHTEVLEPIEISHVGYSMEQCGYDK